MLPRVECAERDDEGERTLAFECDNAHCTAWPSNETRPVPCIGRFEATTQEQATALLESACAELRARGATRVVGPMDGSTWRRYRLVVEGAAEEPPFFLEPTNPPEWPAWWRAAGFAPIETYHSALATGAPSPSDEPADPTLPIRSIDLDRFDEELRRVHALARDAFSGNPFATAIDWPRFQAMYGAIRERLDPSFVLIVDDPSAGRAAEAPVAGFLLALPDPLEAARGAPRRTLLLKSMAVAPQLRSRGLGRRLLAEARRRAVDRGLDRAIYALMHDANRSARIASHTTRVIRRYALFGRSLAP